jgi:hypothetical protein
MNSNKLQAVKHLRTVAAVEIVAAWISIGAAVICAIAKTGRVYPVWFFLIPLFSSGATSSALHKDAEAAGKL